MTCRMARAALFATVCLPVLAAPWFFGAWEQWWFWSFLATIAIGCILFGVTLLTNPAPGRHTRALHVVWIGALPFLLYLLARSLQVPVAMAAHRAVLLHVSGWLVAGIVAFGLTSRQRRVLSLLLGVDLVCLGLYGLVNHAITGSRLVMWARGFEQYYLDHRACGSYYCPNHFAGVMELLLALAAAGLLARHNRGIARTACALAALLALVAIVLSKSRGGMLTAAVLFPCAAVWGLRQLPPAARWSWRAIAISVCGLAIVTFCHIDSVYRDRFTQYIGTRQSQLDVRAQVRHFLTERFPETSRGRMFGGAIRAWKTAPWTGIGPGMHAVVWPHVAATPDGNRELGVWPRRSNEEFFSFEVHNDWLQLLEETGILGLTLFAIPCLLLLRLLAHGLALEHRSWRQHNWYRTSFRCPPVTLTGLLAFAAMAFHSLGDFNLQMPATVWLLAAICALAAAGCTTDAERTDRYADLHHQ